MTLVFMCGACPLSARSAGSGIASGGQEDHGGKAGSPAPQERRGLTPCVPGKPGW